MKSSPVSGIIATLNRPKGLARTLESLAAQNVVPTEVIVADGSSDKETRRVVEDYAVQWSLDVSLQWQQAAVIGAARQRNYGITFATQPYIWFLDDDIEPRPGCLEAMLNSLTQDNSIGGVGSYIENQRFEEPGLYSRLVWRLVGRGGFTDFSGRCFGPMITTYPRHRPNGPSSQEVEWLNSTCTLYRREVLPDPPFDEHFTGYSFMEDVALSRQVRKKHRLVMAKDAWIYHHTKPASYKNDALKLAQMGIESKHHILTHVEGWPAAKAARTSTMYEMLMLPARVVRAIRHPQGWKSLLGAAKGLATVWRRT